MKYAFSKLNMMSSSQTYHINIVKKILFTNAVNSIAIILFAWISSFCLQASVMPKR